MTDHDLELERRRFGQEILREVRHSAVVCRHLAQWIRNGGALSWEDYLRTRTLTASLALHLYPEGFDLVERTDPDLGNVLWYGLRAEDYKPYDELSGFTPTERARVRYLHSVGREPVERVLFTGLKYKDAQHKRDWLFQKWKVEKNGAVGN